MLKRSKISLWPGKTSARGTAPADPAETPPAKHFVVFYDPTSQHSVVEMYRPSQGQDAVARFHAAEIAQLDGSLTDSKQVLFFSAESIDVLIRTHSHYFVETDNYDFAESSPAAADRRHIYELVDVGAGEAQVVLA